MLSILAYMCNSSTGRRTKGNQEFKASLSYIVSLKPAWATCNLPKKNPKQQQKYLSVPMIMSEPEFKKCDVAGRGGTRL